MNQDEQVTPKTKKCPYCAEEVPAEAVKCKYCGEWLVKSQYSNVQALWRLFILSFMTFNIYHIYWFYRNWRDLKNHRKLDDYSPILYTIFLLVPMLNIYFIYSQFKDIQEFAKQAGSQTYTSPGGLTFFYVFLRFIEVISFKVVNPSTHPIDYLLLSIFLLLSSTVVLGIVQNTLNIFWKKEQPELKIRQQFTKKEMACLIIGGIWWVFVLISLVMPKQ
jgi:hypothetical protein